MKKISLMGGKDIIISDEEAENISNSINTAKFIKLRNGDFINVSSIASIVNFKGLPVLSRECKYDKTFIEPIRLYESREGTLYFVDNSTKSGRVYLDDDDLLDVQFIEPEIVDNRLETSKEKKQFFLEDSENKRKEAVRLYNEQKEIERKERERYENLSPIEKKRENLSSVIKIRKMMLSFNVNSSNEKFKMKIENDIRTMEKELEELNKSL